MREQPLRSYEADDCQIKQLRRVTAIGGGHGLGRVLASLQFLQSKLVGIVATTDNGGASGLLRRSHQTIAWGDIRNCLSQLVDQRLAADVLNYRFTDDPTLAGHNFGNLLLHTLNQLSARPLDGIQLLSRLLNVNTRLLPMSESPVDLVADTHEGLECFGELLVDQLGHMPTTLRLSKPVSATPEALRHLQRSDLIIIGPGSFLTSIMPPLLVDKIVETIASNDAPVIFIDNLLPEYSPAGELPLSVRLDWLRSVVGHDIIDFVITNIADPNLTIPHLNSIKAAADAPQRHDKESLRNTLNQALAAISATRHASKGNQQ
ncbi:gluconeogenesis factor YvcK family protein [Pseudidiomarina terrestris]|uniref:Putative gluconeogenesis factor n=1 Tax=Pseudidiomarina terrestris TaxID=2820060 RepID=A0AAW7QWH0_9GAMM|nr:MULTISPECIES: uridine diphosphate-N-acetylglucosamine-binding protein YvcK [unclassified Pseudidiomarina]MDN7123771.1 uridine diphosphate-N-acetylglucosamine-binding protein YvcK [Pseudidiomarina sp. 1APP75-32.1]MDN7126415.1 uridine diphosphate-N-acetylglucosamine-binding protein YvcK [Pseudidiomarina sp. 1APR75-33.1]MDN7135247.1 uridine diphosphate-N-acetylglucosamine-binding protein YvcK [Pseudidiomarina sp. 1ASP75-5]MDN7137920.1 uridine diphosphate-N-acetylglucosamine-binding protein YvcK